MNQKITTSIIFITLATLGYIVVHDDKSVFTAPEALETPINTPEVYKEELFAVADEPLSSLDDTKQATASTSSNAVSSTQEIRQKPSYTILSKNLPGTGWVDNSWYSTRLAAAGRGVVVDYNHTWGGFSFFSDGIDMTNMASIEIALVSTKDINTNDLQVAMNSGGKKTDSIPLAPYLYSTSDVLVYRVPLNLFPFDPEHRSRITDVYVMSATQQKILFTNIAFSKNAGVTPPIKQPEAESTNPAPEAVAEVIPAVPPIDGYTKPSIYFSGLQNTWTVKGLNGAIVVDSVNDERSVTGASVKLKYDLNDGNIVFSNVQGVKPNGMKSIKLKIYGGILDYGWQQLAVTLRSPDGEVLGRQENIMQYTANGILRSRVWNEVLLPLSAFKNGNIGSIEISNYNTTLEGDFLWIDDIHFSEDF